MKDGFKLFVELSDMWAKMLIEVLTDNGVSAVAMPKRKGESMARYGTMTEPLQIFVHEEQWNEAVDLYNQLFASPDEEEES